ncbi:MAG: hybrid sensor histidine kinase/response regulator [Anaerolineae bacterium]
MESRFEVFSEQVRKALRHLDDPVYLETLPLARDLARSTGMSDLSAGQLVRRTLRLGIASLEPSSLGDESSVDATTYQVLYRYALLRRTMTAISQELGMSVRSGYYALSRATEALTRIVVDLLESPDESDSAHPAPSSTPAQRVREELGLLASEHPQEVRVCQLLDEIVQDLQPLADETGIELCACLPAGELRVATKRVLLRQCIVNLLSGLIAASSGGRVTVRLGRCNDLVTVEADGTRVSLPCGASADTPFAIARRIAEALGLAWRQQDGPDTCWVAIGIRLSSRRRVLVVDDNEGVISLIRRYLHSQPYGVWGAHDGQQALSLLDELRPDVIVLDVMLPGQDGWEVLAMLRDACQAMGHDVPVIVCSIIDDPRLASALGARAFLHKPVTRAGLLQALDAVTSV